MLVPQTDIPQFHSREDQRLALKSNCTYGFCSNLSVNNSIQPAARNPVDCETGIPASPPPPRRVTLDQKEGTHQYQAT
jgi:hypothetical protein